MADRRPLHRFYCPETLETGRTIQLDERSSLQIRRVLRLRNGDEIALFNGDGRDSIGRIAQSGRNSVLVEITQEPFPGVAPGPPIIHLGLSLLKSDRFDLAVQKTTELGVASIHAMESERCVVSLPADRVRTRLQRWRSIAVESLEQCGRSDMIEISGPNRFSEILLRLEAEVKLIAWEQESSVDLAYHTQPGPESVALLIGPEGGFSEREVSEAEEAGYHSVSLGPTILRSETAAIAAVVAIRTLFRNRDFTRTRGQ